MIERKSLRICTLEAVQDRILDGRLKPGASIREPRLAAELNVSRSPLREALLKLESSGLLTSDVGRGFFVRPLDVSNASDNYVILATLEGLALRLAGVPTPAVLDELMAINERIDRAKRRAKHLFELDRCWHELLLRECPNRCLMDMIDERRTAVRRYDYAYWREAGDTVISHDEHLSIVRMLRRPNLALAESLLVDHWIRGIDPVVRWLSARSEGDGS